MQITLVIILIAASLAACLGNPVVNLHKREIPDNAFDIGPIDSCIVPTPEQLPTCSQYITYPVPAALLSEKAASIREKAVYGAHRNALSLEENSGSSSTASVCASTIEEIECYQQFPACVDNATMVRFNTTNCENQVVSSCSSTTADTLKISCGSNKDVDVPLSTCRPVTESSTYQYQYCNKLQGWSSIYVTEWMHILLQEEENDIESLSVIVPNLCSSLYTELKCGGVGRCWDQGRRMELNATRELCESVIYWYVSIVHAYMYVHNIILLIILPSCMFLVYM